MPAMSEGLASGLATGLSLGMQQRREQFEESMQQQQSQRAQEELGIRQDEATRAKAKDALTYVTEQKDALARQMAFANDPTQLNTFRARYSDLNKIEREATSHLVGQQVYDYTKNVQSNLGALETGQKKWSEFTPEEATQVFSHLGQGPASDFIDTPERPSPVGDALKQWDQGVATMRKDNGSALINAGNRLFKPAFDGLLGQHTDDGGTIVDVNMGPPTPHPQNPAAVIPVMHLKTVGPDGKPGEKVIPLSVSPDGQLSSMPGANSSVQHLHLEDMFNHVNGLKVLYNAANSSPAIRDKLMQGYLEGHEDKAAEYNDLLHLLGHNQNEYRPKQQLVKDSDGQWHLLDPNVEFKESHDYQDMASARLLSAQAAMIRDQGYRDRAEAGPRPRGFSVIGQTTTQDGKPAVVVFNQDTGEQEIQEVKGAGGAMTNPKANPKTDKPIIRDQVDPKTGKKTGKRVQIITNPDGSTKEVPVQEGGTASGNSAVDAARTKFGY
jgi:hypothetical protein